MSIMSIVAKIKASRQRLMEALNTTQDKTLTQLTEEVLNDYIVKPEEPQDFYNRTRPTDWINIATIEANEIVILVQQPTVIKFDINVPFIYDGTQYPAAPSNFTLTGTGQKEVRIKGVNPITRFSFLDSSSQNKKGSFNIKEIIFNTPNLNSLSFGGAISNDYSDCIQCEYITFINENLTNLDNLFSRNRKLKTVIGLNYSKCTQSERTFRFCENLKTLGVVDLSNSRSLNRMCDSSGIENIDLKMSRPGAFSVLFGWCAFLENASITCNVDLNLEDIFTTSNIIKRVNINTNANIVLNNFLVQKTDLKFLKINRIQ